MARKKKADTAYVSQMVGLEETTSLIEVAVNLNTAVLLIGETGTGKTSLVRDIGNKQKAKVFRVNLNGQTSIDEFVGKYTLQAGETVWQDGILTYCMRKGHWLLIDEINAALPEILFVLHSLLDDDRSIMLVDKDNEIVKAHRNFRVFAAMNPSDEYAGTKELNKALQNRFGMVLRLSYLPIDVERQIITSRTGIKEDDAAKLVDIAVVTRNLHKNGDIFNSVSTRDLISMATLMTAGLSMETAVEVVYLNRCIPDELAVLNSNKISGKMIAVPGFYGKTDVDRLVSFKEKEITDKCEAKIKDYRNQIADLQVSTPMGAAVDASMPF